MTVPFKIDVAAEHGTEVRLNGEKVPGLTNVEVHHRVGRPSRLVLHVHALAAEIVGEAEIEFEIGGRVFVERASADDEGS